MAVALLDLFMLNGKYNLIRTRDNKIIKKHQNDLNSFVIDVGLQYNENKLNFDLNHNDDFNQSIQFLGDIGLKEKRNFE
mgnify:CR=1 FL=1